jgi:hypothetical protein
MAAPANSAVIWPYRPVGRYSQPLGGRIVFATPPAFPVDVCERAFQALP